jgi:hypothetical protein
MRFMNTWEIDEAAVLFEDDPILGPATQTLRSLRDWTDSHSDGWAYWPKPVRAAAKLILLIERGRWDRRTRQGSDVITIAEYKAALRPLKAFRTRFAAEFDIVEL